MSLWRRLFGGSSAPSRTEPEAPAAEAEHNGYLIRAVPYPEGGQYQLAGIISRQVGDEMKEHRFVRADKFASKDEAAQVALAKGRRIVDEQGDSIFR